MSHIRDISVQFLKGVGPARKKIFERLGINDIENLFYFFPRRYEDRTRMRRLDEVRVGEFQTVTGKVQTRAGRQSWYTKKHVYETVIDDGSGRLFAVWFNQPYLDNYFRVGRQVILYGKVDVYKNRLQMVSPEYEILQGDEDLGLNMGRIVPIYPLTRGVTQRYLRKIIRLALDRYLSDCEDALPVWLRNKHHLANIRRSIENIHFPESQEALDQAQYRVSFEEFFFFQLSVLQRRMNFVTKPGIAHQIPPEFIQKFRTAFPFSLTGAQERVAAQIAGDMRQSCPMLRLLQGDVGSGKTLVALFGCLAAVRCGHQAAIMAPTEILAQQHFQNLRQLLAPGPFGHSRIELLVSGLKKADKEALCAQTRAGQVDILIGTHALLSEEVDFKDLSFVVIDEQHKFGVKQRALLSDKGRNPDVLVMTATPIPRTLSLTLFGDLDVSTIDEMPRGRGKIVTRHFLPEREEEVYQIVRARIQAGEQAYIVYPIIEESEKLDLKAAQSMFEQFRDKIFSDIPVGLVHGQMKRAQADEVMGRFKRQEIKILVATTVLEVGIDVPNATVMVIEHAERFGLSQLHQLRGRIGRGHRDSLCLLLSDPATEDGAARLKAILSSVDGFKIAEQDLLIRGPGQYFGRHQHGLNELRFANPATQIDVLERARQEATELVRQDPVLQQPRNHDLKKVIQERYPTYLAHVEAG